MPRSYQIVLPDHEKRRLQTRIEDDFHQAIGAHQRRISRLATYEQKWRNRVEAPKLGDEGKPNFSVPVIQSFLANKWARNMMALLGDDAEIVAKPTGPSDQRVVHKVSRYESWRLFQSMRVRNSFSEFEFRKVLHGRAFAYRPWMTRTYPIRTAGGGRKDVIYYEGPGFIPLAPDELVIAPERGVNSIQEFSYVIRRTRVTPDDLRRGNGTLYQGITPDLLQRAIKEAATGTEDDGRDKQIEAERDEAEGVEYDTPLGAGRALWLWEWYGYWRPLKKAGKDADPLDLKARQDWEADWVVRYLPALHEIVGVQDLMDLYPQMRNRRPFAEASLLKDGSYWSMGFGELLESIEDEATANNRLFTAAGELTVWPVIFARPAAGMKAGVTRIEPGMINWTDDPASVNVIQIRPNMEYGVVKNQDTLAWGERVTGLSDQSSGRAVDRPNAPRTATGQIALLEEGNIRAYLDTSAMREDWGQIIGDLWDLDCSFAREDVFFRVTEEQARGLFDVDTRAGGAKMTRAEFGGRYDFELKFATSRWAREAQKQDFLALFQVLIGLPIVGMNPRAQWMLANMLAKKFGMDNFSDIVPQPPDLDMPKNPDEEWTLMLQGEELEPNPQDDDQVHMAAHQKQIEGEKQADEPDRDALFLLVKHMMAHGQQQRTKMLMQMAVSQVINSVRGNTPETGGIQPGGVPVQLSELRGTIDQIIAAQNPDAAAQPGQAGYQPAGAVKGAMQP